MPIVDTEKIRKSLASFQKYLAYPTPANYTAYMKDYHREYLRLWKVATANRHVPRKNKVDTASFKHLFKENPKEYHKLYARAARLNADVSVEHKNND